MSQLLNISNHCCPFCNSLIKGDSDYVKYDASCLVPVNGRLTLTFQCRNCENRFAVNVNEVANETRETYRKIFDAVGVIDIYCDL